MVVEGQVEGTTHGVQHGAAQPDLNQRALRRLAMGNTFKTWPNLRKVIVDHGVANERVIVSAKKDKTKLLAKCRMYMTLDNMCNWSLRAILKLASRPSPSHKQTLCTLASLWTTTLGECIAIPTA